ncbi:hypothetical protein EW146_g998 [Bondarzewia mesenterica]|uniref:cellulase n=1 Tax=Bondarzewia mesenterica TaxID=1095465 RepID=A0A4S4M764_9AGAM|nr:hypothetical protein EW146_g998 [Bondarzewia mesenterica]
MTMKIILALGIVSLSSLSARAQQTLYGQCGGSGWTGATTCVSGAVCTLLNDYYSQCLPSTGATTTTSGAATTSGATSTVAISSTVTSSIVTSSTATSTSACAANSPPSSAGKLTFAGVNIAGFDFGCSTDGTCTASAAYPPLTQYYGADGAGQMQHFVEDDGYNVFRLPVGWQFLTNDVLGGTLNDTNFAKYDALVQACLATGASCIIDIHNYARWNGQIIGQGGPTNDQFAALWSSIATKYATEPKVIFGVMNEPHDVPDIIAWAASVQAAVTAIRQAGATSQLILLPGNNWTSAATFVSNGSADALNKVINPDGSTTNLIFDVHKYLDSDNSGSVATTAKRSTPRPEAENVADCVTYMSQQIAYQAANSDVFLGYVGWAAGNFYLTYVLGETPTQSGTTWTDTLLVSGAMSPKENALVA